MHFNPRRLFSLVVTLATGLSLAVPAFAQTPAPARPRTTTAPGPGVLAGTISGRVTDRGKEGIAFANVIVLGTKQGTMTDDNGNFVIRGVPVGTQQIQVLATGYDKLLESVQVNAGATATLALTVGASKITKTLEEIEVKAEVIIFDPSLHDWEMPQLGVEQNKLVDVPSEEKFRTGIGCFLVSVVNQRGVVCVAAFRRPRQLYFPGEDQFVGSSIDAQIGTFAFDELGLFNFRVTEWPFRVRRKKRVRPASHTAAESHFVNSDVSLSHSVKSMCSMGR